ncbi:DUF4232 domain-containing protein [Pseudonocardia nantongensis]|uniref:DUF4232 domain-containing protein n=1 Tax=Pseudonocardia nantongensis TaxID=1181885 RepID=UPI00397E1CB6
MKIVRVPLAAGVLAAGLLLAGCGGQSWPSGAAPASSAPPATSPAPDSAAPPTPAGGSGGGADEGSGENSGGDAGTPEAAGRCTDGDLDAAPGRTTGEAGQRHTTIVWTNSSSQACTMTGFGGVDLRGPDDPTFGPTYSLPRSSTAAEPVRLAPGDTAHTLITWLPPQDGPGWAPTEIAITPPDETTSKTVAWPGGAVQRQDGATRPGTYIDPVAAGSEG